MYFALDLHMKEANVVTVSQIKGLFFLSITHPLSFLFSSHLIAKSSISLESLYSDREKNRGKTSERNKVLEEAEIRQKKEKKKKKSSARNWGLQQALNRESWRERTDGRMWGNILKRCKVWGIKFEWLIRGVNHSWILMTGKWVRNEC